MVRWLVVGGARWVDAALVPLAAAMAALEGHRVRRLVAFLLGRGARDGCEAVVFVWMEPVVG